MTSNETVSRCHRDLRCVTIGVLTALEEEYAACRRVFDPDGTGEEHQRRASSGMFTCHLCHVTARNGDGLHVVAITLLPDMGNNSAAIAANILLQHCPHVRYLIMCGIAGAVPHPEKVDDHVRLGDIVVSSAEGIVQYDRGKQRDPRAMASSDTTTSITDQAPDPLAGFELRSPPRAPSPDLLNAVKRMHSDELIIGRNVTRAWENKIEVFLDKSGNEQQWKRPHPNTDRLIDSPDGSGPTISPPRDRKRRTVQRVACPRVFRGPIGAANIVQADPARRNALRDRFGVKAIEMESSGVADAGWVAGVGYLVVRGTCDYCNTTKNDAWHNYAALIAACYAHTVIEYLHPVESSELLTAPQLPSNVLNSSLRTLPRRDSKLPAEAAAATSADDSISRVIESVEIQVGADESSISPEKVAFITVELERSATTDTLRYLLGEIEELLQEHRWSEVPALADRLENRVRQLPRKGADVRAGWLLLARVEEQQLRTAKLAQREVDICRLTALRKEAESVID